MSSTLAAASADEVLEDLYSRHARDVYRYALAVLGNSADAEDVLQTTFLNAYRAVKGGERPRVPRHWLIKIAHNACRTRAIRASRRPREVPLEGRAAELAAPETERPDLQPVLDALGTLPFNQRAALVMRELEGRTYEQIAENLGVTVSAVETLIFRARRSLRLRREALEPLVAVPLPASLASFGSATATGGGAALASGAAVKAAAIVAALVAGGAALETAHPLASARGSSRDRVVAATTAAPRPAADLARAPTRTSRPTPAKSSRPSAPRRARRRAAPAATVPDAPPPTAPPPARSAAGASSPQPAARTSAAPRRGVEQALPRVELPAATVPSVTVTLPPPQLPALPPAPPVQPPPPAPPPVQVPPLPPAPTVSVPSATVPSPPALS